ncbi:MFS transporter [Brachyspira hampsonii]|uniref:Major facilitator superfamily protein n=1 Tax=Brachyspira hampsonii 30446 TaxID=1289135 RepID=A0A2U4EU32_9SPIR|nr:MFS transporter [Brachyspira hampsonii]EKV56078.1 major facilitator superfamily protein [Brachyspira hampsonii 30446]MBW5390717.1 MFS transporter [Brachyspira hampsonii]MBW5394340.1 MFS transporter [Brachyspira hampsonii]OEJ18079.1 MFS transporter [Brachyspira hampsonii]
MSNLLFIIMSLLWLSLYVYIPYQVTFLSSLNITSSMIGIIIGVYGAAQMFLKFPFGLLNDYIGKCRSLIILAGLLTSFGGLIRLLNTNQYGFLIGGTLCGISASIWTVFMVLYASYFNKNEEYKATSKALVASVLGMFIAFLTAAIFYDKLGMKFLLLVSTVSGALVSLLGLFLKDNEHNKKMSFNDLFSVIKNKRLIVFSLLAVVMQGVQMSAVISFTLNRIKELGGSSQNVGAASIISMFFAIVGAFVPSKIKNENNIKKYIPISFIIMALYCIIVISVNNVFIVMASQVLGGFSSGILASLLTSESVKDIDIDKKSSAMGFFQSTYSFGIFIFPIITGKLIDIYSINIAYIVLTVISILSSIIAAAYYNKNK